MLLSQGDFMKPFKFNIDVQKKLLSGYYSNYDDSVLALALDVLSLKCRVASDTWWTTKSGKLKKRNKGELLMLAVSELAEAMEGERRDLMDDKLPHRRMAEVEIADCFIRLFDYCGAHGYDVGGALIEKMAYNAKRADHKPENRAK